MRSSESPYSILGIPEGSTEGTIKQAYKKLARELHPDKNPDQNTTAKFQETQNAYDALTKNPNDQILEEDTDEIAWLVNNPAFQFFEAIYGSHLPSFEDEEHGFEFGYLDITLWPILLPVVSCLVLLTMASVPALVLLIIYFIDDALIESFFQWLMNTANTHSEIRTLLVSVCLIFLFIAFLPVEITRFITASILTCVLFLPVMATQGVYQSIQSFFSKSDHTDKSSSYDHTLIIH